ncbi:unnamed protein product, partial [Didymodactylos carnosus]
HRLYQFKKHQRPYRIILIRHGESLANVDKTIYTRIPDSQIDLTDAGIEQARQAGKQLREIIRNETLYVYLSPYKRSKQTYDAIARDLTARVRWIRLKVLTVTVTSDRNYRS